MTESGPGTARRSASSGTAPPDPELRVHPVIPATPVVVPFTGASAAGRRPPDRPPGRETGIGPRPDRPEAPAPRRPSSAKNSTDPAPIRLEWPRMTVSSQLRAPTRTNSNPTSPGPGQRPGRARLLDRLFDRLAPRLHRYGMRMLRGGLGGVFVWFGVLKMIGLSPAAQLVVDVMPFDTGDWFVPALGWAEVALGVWLLTGRAQRLLLPILGGHLLGTFAVLLLTPGAAFDHANPLLLTMTGEFVVKNVVLLAAAVVLTTTPHHPDPSA
ncbi:hypothetical protein ACIGO8_10130 [Streptomyces sp. NPDC053493]|uniref:hypothetical protein n=1 Tax=Streptomyces sp. NPDC053493 TaxID=3365705 RepID=UPI0037D25F1D